MRILALTGILIVYWSIESSPREANATAKCVVLGTPRGVELVPRAVVVEG